MAGRQYLLICAIGVATAATPLLAQDPQPTATPTPAKPGGKRAGRGGAPNSPEFDNVRRALEALTPEQRRRFQENFARWINLSPEEKRLLRDRDELRRKRIGQEIDRAIQQTGLQLEGEQREQFAKRYAEERRKVEEQLRREMDEKRQPRLREIVGKLKEEFSRGTSTTATTPSPGSTAATSSAVNSPAQ